jgi:hypothetical protein
MFLATLDYTKEKTHLDIMEHVRTHKRVPTVWGAGHPRQLPNRESSLLLRLPGELRNNIYDYALTIDDKVIVTKLGDKPALCVTVPQGGRFTKDVEINQLQYVNKMLRVETKGYGLKRNDIHFATIHYDDPSPMAACLQFLMCLAPRWLESVRKVYIRREEADPPSFDGFANLDVQKSLINICRDNPHITIHWACSGWLLPDTICRFLLDSISLVDAYRGIDIRPKLGIDGYVLGVSKPWCGKSLDIKDVPNFRVHPWNVCEARGAFARRLKDAVEYCDNHNEAVRERQEELESQIWSWFDNGV